MATEGTLWTMQATASSSFLLISTEQCVTFWSSSVVQPQSDGMAQVSWSGRICTKPSRKRSTWRPDCKNCTFYYISTKHCQNAVQLLYLSFTKEKLNQLRLLYNQIWAMHEWLPALNKNPKPRLLWGNYFSWGITECFFWVVLTEFLATVTHVNSYQWSGMLFFQLKTLELFAA